MLNLRVGDQVEVIKVITLVNIMTGQPAGMQAVGTTGKVIRLYESSGKQIGCTVKWINGCNAGTKTEICSDFSYINKIHN